MLKKPIALLLVILLLSNQAYSYFNDEDRFKHNNNYTIEENFNYSDTSYLSDFSLNTNFQDDFKQNPIHSSMLDMWSKNDDYQEKIDSQVAPNFNLSDYTGYEVTNNTKWENYSSTTDSYEQQLCTNVLQVENKYQSLDISTLRNDWMVKDSINNIGYNKDSNITNFTVSTFDIGGNKLEQQISNIKYQEGNQIKAFEDLKYLCQNKLSSNNKTFNFDTALNMLSSQSNPPTNFPSSFDMLLTNPKGNVTSISFTNLAWDKNNITSFDSKLTSPEGLIKEVKVDSIINDNKITSLTVNTGEKILNWDNTSKLSLDQFKNNVTKDINPLDILGGSKVQLGDDKLVYLAQKYDNDGYLDNANKKFSIDYGITSKNNLKNTIKKDLFALEQVAPGIVRSNIQHQDIKHMKVDNLIKESGSVYQAIHNNLSNFKRNVEVKTSWGDTFKAEGSVKFELKDKKIICNNDLVSQDGTKLSKAEFILKDNKLVAVSGTLQKTDNTPEIKEHLWKQPEIKKRKSFFFSTIKKITNTVINVMDAIKVFFGSAPKRPQTSQISDTINTSKVNNTSTNIVKEIMRNGNAKGVNNQILNIKKKDTTVAILKTEKLENNTKAIRSDQTKDGWLIPKDPKVITLGYWNNLTTEQQKILHYNKNQYQQNIPKYQKDLKKTEWAYKGYATAHNLNGATGNIDFRGIGERIGQQAIYGKGVLVTEPENVGSYDLADTTKPRSHHLMMDVKPWIEWGNSANDSTTKEERIESMRQKWLGRVSLKYLGY